MQPHDMRVGGATSIVVRHCRREWSAGPTLGLRRRSAGPRLGLKSGLQAPGSAFAVGKLRKSTSTLAQPRAMARRPSSVIEQHDTSISVSRGSDAQAIALSVRSWSLVTFFFLLELGDNFFSPGAW